MSTDDGILITVKDDEHGGSIVFYIVKSGWGYRVVSRYKSDTEKWQRDDVLRDGDTIALTLHSADSDPEVDNESRRHS